MHAGQRIALVSLATVCHPDGCVSPGFVLMHWTLLGAQRPHTLPPQIPPMSEFISRPAGSRGDYVEYLRTAGGPLAPHRRLGSTADGAGPLAEQGEVLQHRQSAALSSALAHGFGRDAFGKGPSVDAWYIGAACAVLVVVAAAVLVAIALQCMSRKRGDIRAAALAAAAVTLSAVLAAGTAAVSGRQKGAGAALLTLGLMTAGAALLLAWRRLSCGWRAQDIRSDKAVPLDIGLGSPETLLYSARTASPYSKDSRGPGGSGGVSSEGPQGNATAAGSAHTTPPRSAECSPSPPASAPTITNASGKGGFGPQAAWQRLTSTLSKGRSGGGSAAGDSESFHFERFFEGGGGADIQVDTGALGGGAVCDASAMAGPPRPLRVKTKLGPRQRVVDALETANLRFVQMLREKILLPQPQAMALRAANTIALQERDFLAHSSSQRDVAKVRCRPRNLLTASSNSMMARTLVSRAFKNSRGRRGTVPSDPFYCLQQQHDGQNDWMLSGEVRRAIVRLNGACRPFTAGSHYLRVQVAV
jgi:hypothetical protein